MALQSNYQIPELPPAEVDFQMPYLLRALVAAHGNTRGRSYTLSASVYSVVSDKAAYTRQVGFGPIQHEQMVLSYIRQHGKIKRAEVMDLCRLTEGQAKALLRRLIASHKIRLRGIGKGVTYVEFASPAQI